MRRTWVVIPMFNEATTIGGVIEDVRRVFPHVVCVDDGSTDASAQIARNAGARVVRHPINLGQGASLQTGFSFALADPAMTEIVTFDADGQHQVADARAMVETMREGEYDAVLGSRFLDGRTKVSGLKRLVLKAAARWSRWTSGLELTDAHNGLRVLSRGLASKIELRQNRMAHASELIDQIGRHADRLVEYPTHIVYTDYSKSKGQSLLNSVNILVDLIFK